jgi:SET domain-containing protein
MANHSCVPNAMVQFVGRKAILRAETDIKQDDEVEISYTGTFCRPVTYDNSTNRVRLYKPDSDEKASSCAIQF